MIEDIDASTASGSRPPSRNGFSGRSPRPTISAAIGVVSGTSIGIAIVPNDGTTCDDIVKNADLALYRAKDAGRGTHRFFEPEMDRHMRARHTLEQELRNALVRGEFELHYQPFVDARHRRDRRLRGAAALEPSPRGLVMPGEFIALAEETGLIVPIGEWVLMMACTEAARWPAHFKISTNLSPAQFKSTGAGAGGGQRARHVGDCAAAARARGDRDRDHARQRIGVRERSASCAASACGSRWTISAPAIRR